MAHSARKAVRRAVYNALQFLESFVKKTIGSTDKYLKDLFVSAQVFLDLIATRENNGLEVAWNDDLEVV